MPPRKKSETPTKKAKTPKKKTPPRDDPNEDTPAVPVVAPNQDVLDGLEEEIMLAEALDEALPDDSEEELIEFAAEEGEREGEGEGLPEQPVEPDDDRDEQMDVDEPPRGEEDAPAAVNNPPPPVSNAAAPVAAPVPAPALTDAQRVRQETDAIARNWGPGYRTLRNCIPAGTWLKGSTEKLTEYTCEPATLQQMRELSDATPNLGKEVMKQIESRWTTRRQRTGDIGTTPVEKQKSLLQDLKWILEEYTEQPEAQGKGKKRPAGNNGAEMSGRRKSLRRSAKPNYNDLDPDRLHQDEEDDSSSGSDSIPHDGPAGGAEKTAARAKQNGKAPATATGSNAMQATVLTESQRGQALSNIYINWGIHSVYLSFPLALFQAGIASDTAVDLRVLARLLDLSNLHTGMTQGLAIRNRLVAQIQDRWRPASSVDEALALLAQFGGPTHATERTPGRPMTRASAAITRGGPSMKERGQGAPLPTLDTARPSALDMIGGSFGDDRPAGGPMVRPGDRGARGNALIQNRLSSFSRNMPSMPGRHDPPTQLGRQRPSLAGNMGPPSDLRVLLRAAEHDASRADEQAAADMHRYEHSVLTAVDRHREVERIRGMVAQEDGGAEGRGPGKDGDDGVGGGQDEGNGKKTR
ncbi:hypothetical protein J4E80_004903 [Alternaria sp. BMP 0032]|nr:hypothetical protein J4E80_004903 [Alternaria sp. BMP 0032]